MSEPIFIVLEDSVHAADVVELAARVGWRPTGATARGFDVMASRRFADAHGTEVLYAEDHVNGCRWLRIAGDRASSVELVVRGALPWVRPGDVYARIETGDPVACIRAAGALAATRPPTFDADHFAALRRLLTHAESAVRRAGVRASFGCRWPQLRALVDELRRKEERPQPRLEALASWFDVTDDESSG